MLCEALYSGDKITRAGLMALSLSQWICWLQTSAVALGKKSWRDQYGHHGLTSIRAGVEWGQLWSRASAGPCVPSGRGGHCPLHRCGTCPPLGPCCSCRLGSEKRRHPASVFKAIGCSCREHCEVGSYCAGFWCGNVSCPAAGQTSACHQAGLASLAFCKQTPLPLLAELCSG